MRPWRSMVVAAMGAATLWVGASVRGEGAESLSAGSKPAAAATPFRQMLAEKYQETLKTGQPVHGVGDWLFLGRELAAYMRGPFWGAANAERIALERWQERVVAAKASGEEPDEKPDAKEIARQDPLPAIVDFSQQCKKAGVELVLVPVPGKVVFEGDKVNEKVKPDAKLDADVGENQRAFYEVLRKQGVTVVDLTEALAGLKKKGQDTHLHRDTHWSPAAAQEAAVVVAAELKKQRWYPTHPWKEGLEGPKPRGVNVESEGDLAAMMKGPTFASHEVVHLEQVVWPGEKFVESDPKGPVVVMGDSHVLVYHDNLIGSHAGFVDHLAMRLDEAVEVMGTRGSGANAGRLELARRGGNLAGKKCIVWVFTAREFTEASAGWQKIPVVK